MAFVVEKGLYKLLQQNLKMKHISVLVSWLVMWCELPT